MAFRSWILAVFFAAPLARAQPVPILCDAAYESLALDEPPAAMVVKERADGTRILRVEEKSGVFYFRERPRSQGAVAEQKAIFDNPEMPGVAYRFTRGLGIDRVVPEAHYEPQGIAVRIAGRTLQTRGGVLQQEVSGLVTPIDEWKKLHPGLEPSANDIVPILNQGEWPRLYADWKILWRILGQVDLSVENLAAKNGQIALFDLGDAFNTPSVRARMGIVKEIDNVHFNMPQKPWDRVEFRADFRRADPEFKNFARTIAGESDEATARRLGLGLDDHFPPPRGSVREQVKYIKQEARHVVDLLDKDPLHY